MKNILIVDDSILMRQTLTLILKSSGYTVVSAVDGVDGLNTAKTHKFDCVITDINMPNKDGITLTKDLRALEGYKNIPILILTTEVSTDKKAQGKAAGATAWVGKPLRPDQLIKTLKIIFDKKDTA